MHLYQGTSEQFIADAVQARLANQLSDRFFEEFRYKPAPSEVMSWRNSLGAMANVLQVADLTLHALYGFGIVRQHLHQLFDFVFQFTHTLFQCID